MRILNILLFIGCLILVSGTATKAQRVSITGVVKGSDHSQPPRGWQAQVRVFVNGERVSDDTTNPDLFNVFADRGSIAKIWYSSIGYEPWETNPINVGDQDRMKMSPPTVTLVKLTGRGGLTLKSAQQRAI